MPLNDGRVQPELASHPLFHITTAKRPDPLRDLLPERVLREFEQERTFGRFRGHAPGVARLLIKSVACSGSGALGSRFLSTLPPGLEDRRCGARAASLQGVAVAPERWDREPETSVGPCV